MDVIVTIHELSCLDELEFNHQQLSLFRITHPSFILCNHIDFLLSLGKKTCDSRKPWYILNNNEVSNKVFQVVSSKKELPRDEE